MEDIDKKAEEESTKKNNKNNIMTEVFNQNKGASKQKNVKLTIKGGRNIVDDRFEIMKQDGNKQFKDRKYREAIKIYSKCLVRDSKSTPKRLLHPTTEALTCL